MCAAVCARAVKTPPRESNQRGAPSFLSLQGTFQIPMPTRSKDLPWTELVTGVAPNDLVVNTKKRLSTFYPTDLDFLLRNVLRFPVRCLF